MTEGVIVQQVQGLLRHALTALGAGLSTYLAANAAVTPEQFNAFWGYLSGAIVSLVPLAVSVIWTWRSNRAHVIISTADKLRD